MPRARPRTAATQRRLTQIAVAASVTRALSSDRACLTLSVVVPTLRHGGFAWGFYADLAAINGLLRDVVARVAEGGISKDGVP